MILRTMTKVSRRQYLRLNLTPPITADLSISAIKGQAVQTKSRPVMVQNISLAGLCYLSALNLPVSADYVLEFNIPAQHAQLKLRGQVRWRRKQENLFEYGVAFIPAPSSSMSKKLLCFLNQQLLRQSPIQARIHYIYKQLSVQ